MTVFQHPASSEYVQALPESFGRNFDLCQIGMGVLIIGVDKHPDRTGGREQLAQKLDVLLSQATIQNAHPSEVTAWSAEAVNKARLNRIGSGNEDNRDGRGRSFCRKGRGAIEADDYSHATAHEFARKRGQAIVLPLSPAPLDSYVSVRYKAGVSQSFGESDLCAGI